MTRGDGSRLRALARPLGRSVLVAATIASASCAGSGHSSPTPFAPTNTVVPAGFVNVPAEGKRSVPDWWHVVAGSTADELIALTLARNTELKVAAERLAEMDALARAGSARLGAAGDVRLTGTMGAGGSRASAGSRPSLALLGGGRGSARAAKARASAAGSSERDVRLRVVAGVTRALVDLGHARRATALVKRRTARLKRLDAVVARRVGLGLASELDADRIRSRHLAMRATVPELRAREGNAMSRLASATALYPAQIERQLSGFELPASVPPSLDPGLPIDVVRGRADVVAREHDLVAAMAGIGVARAALLPQLRLSGDLTLALPGSGRAQWSFLPQLSMPVLGRAALREEVRAAVARARSAHAAWEGAIRSAVIEVDAALANVAVQRERESRAREAMKAANAVERRALAAFDREVATADDVLDAAIEADGRRLAHGEARRALRLAWIDLNVALGHGPSQDRAL